MPSAEMQDSEKFEKISEKNGCLEITIFDDRVIDNILVVSQTRTVSLKTSHFLKV